MTELQFIEDKPFSPENLLERQLRYALGPGACFCVHCGQPDELELHDPAKCAKYNQGDPSVAMALDFFDQVQDELPDDRDQAILGTFLRLRVPPNKAGAA
jgi:hypothetical protein